MATVDTFARHELKLEGPAVNAEPVTPSDSATLTHTSRGLYIGVDGDMAVQMAGGQVVTFSNMYGGTIIPIRAVKVFSTGTTAGNILNLY